MASLTTEWLDRLDAILDALGDTPLAADVYYQTQDFEPGYVAAAAIARGGGGGASFPPEWTIGDEGSVVFRPGVADGDEGAFVAIVPPANPDNDDILFVRAPNDTTGNILSLGAGSSSSFKVKGDASVSIRPKNSMSGAVLLVVSPTNQAIFRVDSDESVHIKTGTTIQADL